MKKIIHKIALVATVAVVAGYGVYNSQKQEATLSETALANVEALANDETSDGYNIVDRVESSYIDPVTNEKRTIITYVCEGDGPLACG